MSTALGKVLSFRRVFLHARKQFFFVKMWTFLS